MTGILLFIAIIPSIILGWYINKKDKIEKEPKGLLAKIFIFGVLTVIPAIILELIVAKILVTVGISEKSNYIGLFIYVLLGVGLIEEGVKWLSLKLFTWNDKEFNHIYDAVVYAVFTSLGFATIENILYVLENGLGTGLMRAVLSVPGHAFFGVYMGYYYGIAKHYSIYGSKDLTKKNLWLSILMPTLLHTLFDFCLFAGSAIFIVIYFIIVVYLYISAFGKIKQLSNVNTNFIPSTTNVVQQPMYQPQQMYQQPMNYQPPTQAGAYAKPVQQPTNYQPQPQAGAYVQPVQQPQPQVVQQVQQPQPQPTVVSGGESIPKFCTNCGTPVKGKFCTGCGKQNY